MKTALRICTLWLSAVLLIAPAAALACACGCGVFDVQTSSMLPTSEGGTAWIEYDFMNQNKNWSGNSSAPAENNEDKVLRTHFFTLGGQYMWNRGWGMMATVPYWDRYFKTTDENDNIRGFNHAALGDIKISGIYSGFSKDMSSGITFGLKLPTGDYSYAGFDRDTAIGTGSTDLLLGAYHMDRVAKEWVWFVNGITDLPFLYTAGYRPGSELDAVSGVYYDKWSYGGIKVSPLTQVIGSYRFSDHGPAAKPDDSGYRKLLLSPGVELRKDSWKLYADVAFPVYEHVNGNQLVAEELFKVSLSHDF